MKRSVLLLVAGAVVGIYLIELVGSRFGWTPLAVFGVTAAFLIGLALVRSGVTRPLMIIFVFLQAIPAFGIGTVARWAPPLVLALLTVMWWRWVRKLGQSSLVPRNDNEVVPGARRAVDQLLALGFQMVGSADAAGPGYRTIFNYLVSADRRTYAVASDRVQALASQFGDRMMVSIDRASIPVPASELRQLVRSDIAGLYETHKAALQVLAALGHQPEHLDPSRVVERSLAEERRTIDFLTARPAWVAWQIARGVARRRPPDSRLIDGSEGTASRVERWAASS